MVSYNHDSTSSSTCLSYKFYFLTFEFIYFLATSIKLDTNTSKDVRVYTVNYPEQHINDGYVTHDNEDITYDRLMEGNRFYKEYRRLMNSK